jgi:hypothetical protein
MRLCVPGNARGPHGSCCWGTACLSTYLLAAAPRPPPPPTHTHTCEGVHNHHLVRVASAACLHAYGCLHMTGGDEAVVLQCCRLGV